MRAFPLLALLILPATALAQSDQPNSPRDNTPRTAADFAPAPVPSVSPPDAIGGSPATPPEQILPSDTANGHDRTPGGDGSLVPNTSK